MDKPLPEVNFTFVRYANCWEDADILCEALRPKAGQHVLSIASAGDNALSLLTNGASVTACDLNPSQLACCELRKAAIAAFEQPQFLRFAGITADDGRWSMYTTLQPRLPKAAREYWQQRRQQIETGFIHHGKFEQYFTLFRRRVLPLAQTRKRVASLLDPKSVDERERFYEKRWNNLRWRAIFRVFFSRAVMGKLGRDPEFFRHVEGSVATRILSRTRYALTQLDPSENPYLNYILTGNFGSALPHYLCPDNYAAIRRNIDRITFKLGAIDQIAAETGAESFDAFNLSDIFEYLSPEQTTQLYQRLECAAKPGARFAYWNMLVPRSCPESLRERIYGLEQEAERLFAEDRAFFYSRFVLEQKR